MRASTRNLGLNSRSPADPVLSSDTPRPTAFCRHRGTLLPSQSSPGIIIHLYSGQYDQNTISACNWGIGAGDGGANALVNNFQIYDNIITMPGTQWDDPNDNNHHNLKSSRSPLPRV